MPAGGASVRGTYLVRVGIGRHVQIRFMVMFESRLTIYGPLELRSGSVLVVISSIGLDPRVSIARQCCSI